MPPFPGLAVAGVLAAACPKFMVHTVNGIVICQVAEQIVDFEGLFLTGRANRGNIMYRKQIFNAACVYVATYFLSSVLLPAGFLKIQPEFFILGSV